MRRQTLILAILLLLGFASAYLITGISDDVQQPNRPSQSAVEVKPSSTTEIEEPSRPAADMSTEVAKANSTERPAEPKEKPKEKPIPEGHWRLTGQLVKAFEVQYEPLQNLNLSQCELDIGCKPKVNPNGNYEHFIIEDIDTAGFFSVDVPLSHFSDTAGDWVYSITSQFRWGPRTARGRIIFSLPDCVVIVGRNNLSPKVVGESIDFGKISLSIKSLFSDTKLIHGRIMHSSGQALSNWNDSVLVATKGPAPVDPKAYVWLDDVAELATDSEGYYLARVECQMDGTPIAKRQWNLSSRSNWDSLHDSYTSLNGFWRMDLPAPVKGKVCWEMGTTTLDGCLLEVEFEGAKPEHNLYNIELYFDCGDDSSMLTYTGEGGSCIMLPGRYNWWIKYNTDAAILQDASGTVLVDSGLSKLVVTVVERPSVKISIDMETRINSEGWAIGYCGFDVSYWAKGVVGIHKSYSEFFMMLPVTYILLPLDMGVLDVKVSSTEHLTQRFEVSPDSNDFEIKLMMRETIEVVLELPVVPVEMGAHSLSSKCFWSSVDGEGSYGSLDVQISKTSSVATYTLEKTAGYYEFTLTGGENWGYPGGIYTSTQAYIGGDKPSIVKFDPIPPPPWKFRASEREIITVVDGQEVKLGAGLENGEGLDLIYQAWREWDRCGPLKDGTATIFPEMTEPQKYGDKATITYNMPHRITVTGTKHDQPAMKFAVDAEGEGFCYCKTENGIAKLWLAPGKATLKIRCNDKTYFQNIEVFANQITEVQFESFYCEVKLRSNNGQVTEPWDIYIVDNDSDVQFCDYVILGRKARLLPGKYIAVGPDGHTIHEFEVLANEETKTVLVPDLVIKTADIFIDVKTPLEPAVVEFFWAAVSDDSGLNLKYYHQQKRLSFRRTKDGYLLKDVPLGLKVCIYGGATVGRGEPREDNPLAIWALKPFSITIEKEDQTVLAETFNGRQPDLPWFNYKACILSFESGLSLPISYGLPAGRHEYGFYSMGKLVLREWITVPVGVKAFDLPEAVKKRLAELEAGD